MLAREIFYNYNEAALYWDAVKKAVVGPSASTPTDTAATTTDGSPYVGTTTTDPSQSSYRIPILSRFNGMPSQANSPSVLNAGLTITTPPRRV